MTVLPREHRLHPRSRVRATIRHGRRVRSGSIVVHYVADGSSPRAAVIVGKGFGGAVQRHRRQRQVRHALARIWDRLPAGSYVVRALPADVGFPQVSDSLEAAVARL